MGERVVYSTSGGQVQRCKKCRKQRCACPRAVAVVPADVSARVRLEVRKGKQVTVVMDLPHNPDYWKGFLKQLKQQLCCGGSLKDDRLELQGDQRQALRGLLEESGFRVR